MLVASGFFELTDSDCDLVCYQCFVFVFGIDKFSFCDFNFHVNDDKIMNDINNHIISDLICGVSCCLSSALFLAGFEC